MDRKNHLMVIVNQSTEHPSCPPLPKNQRVNDYWSYMVIKPSTTFRKEGLEFVVTYFDNPGIVMPPTVTKWVSRIYMPDFLNRLHQATIKYAIGKNTSLVQDERFNDETVDTGEMDYFWNNYPDPGHEYPPEREFVMGEWMSRESSSGGGGGSSSAIEQCRSVDQMQSESAHDEQETEEEKTGEGGRSSWWSYLHPYSYFAW